MCVCWGFQQRGRPSQSTALEVLTQVREGKKKEKDGMEGTTPVFFFFFSFSPPLGSAYLKYLIMIQQYNSNRIAGLKANATVTMSFIFLPVVFIRLLLGTKSLNPFPNTWRSDRRDLSSSWCFYSCSDGIQSFRRKRLSLLTCCLIQRPKTNTTTTYTIKKAFIFPGDNEASLLDVGSVLSDILLSWLSCITM